jgi:hypothetical protein
VEVKKEDPKPADDKKGDKEAEKVEENEEHW